MFKLNDFTRIIMAAAVLPFVQADVLRAEGRRYGGKIPMALDWALGTVLQARDRRRKVSCGGVEVRRVVAGSGRVARGVSMV